MKFTILGSGTSVPHKNRSSSGYWLETENGSLLLDLGASAIQRIADENLDWVNLDAIWISHFHLDHIGGLAPFLFGTKYAPKTQNRKKTLKIFGAKGLKNIIEHFNEANDYGLLEQPFPLEIIEIEPLEKFEILENVEAVAMETPHTDESLAIHLRDENNKIIVYTADTGFTKSLGVFAKNADLLVMECSFLKNSPVETHLTLPEAMFLTRFAEPKSVILTHLYPEWDEVDFNQEVAKFSPACEVLEAKDGLSISV